MFLPLKNCKYFSVTGFSIFVSGKRTYPLRQKIPISFFFIGIGKNIIEPRGSKILMLVSIDLLYKYYSIISDKLLPSSSTQSIP